MSRSVVCPTCCVRLTVPTVPLGQSFLCPCGQEMRMAPPRRKTVLVHPKTLRPSRATSPRRLGWFLAKILLLLAVAAASSGLVCLGLSPSPPLVTRGEK